MLGRNKIANCNGYCRDNLVILQILMAAMVATSPAFPGVAELRAWDPRGWALALLLHVAVSEPAFYWAHRALHRGPLFSLYHAKHHSSHVTQPFTGTYSFFYETWSPHYPRGGFRHNHVG